MPPATWKTNPPRNQATKQTMNTIKNNEKNMEGLLFGHLSLVRAP
jgi:hypothetical protein